MYNQSYDEYIKNVLGYPLNRDSFASNVGNTTYNNYSNNTGYGSNMDFNNMAGYGDVSYNNMGYNSLGNNYYQNMVNRQDVNLEECYPDIYKIVYPMIQKVCANNVRPITRQTIDEMVNDIYKNLEVDENTENRSESKQSNEKSNVKSLNKTEVENRTSDSRETKQNNSILKDLIRILLIRELLGRQNRPGQRPQQFPNSGGGMPFGMSDDGIGPVIPQFFGNSRSSVFDKGYNIF